MLAAVIRAESSANALAATVASLIPAVAEGFLGHAVMVDAVGSEDTVRLADATGASYLRDGGGGWQAGAEQARGEWLLLIEAGEVLPPHWMQFVEHHLTMRAREPALIPLSGAVAGFSERLALMLRPRRPRAGLIMPKAQVVAGALETAPRRLAAKRERF